MSWKPTSSLNSLQIRANLYHKIREFFAVRGVLEVETPLVAHSSVPDPHIHSFTTSYQAQTFYLQTSPEFAMKRLLASGSGPIYQICKAFRDGEKGPKHNPEFTMLEWYRPGFDLPALMDEMQQLLTEVCGFAPAQRMSYGEAFQRYLDLDPHHASIAELKTRVEESGLVFVSNHSSSPSVIPAHAGIHGSSVEDKFLEPPDLDKDGWLFLLMSHFIEPHLGTHQPLFLYDFPAKQAALARIKPGNPPLTDRFEVYYQGMELANGFHELTDAKEQEQRFLEDNAKRKTQDIPVIPLDKNFLDALHHGLPLCSGVALGLDRLLMILTKAQTIDEVLSFTVDNA